MNIAGYDIIISGKIIKIAQPKDSWYQHLENPEVVLKDIIAAKVGVDIFSFWQTLPDTKPLHNYLFEWDNVAAIPIKSYDYWLNTQIVKNTRKKIKKFSSVGVTVKEVPFDDAFCSSVTKIYNETPVRQGRRFALYGANVEMIKRKYGDKPESSVFLGAFYEEELIGYLKLMIQKNFIRATGTLTSTLHRDKPAMNALIAKAVQYCAIHQYPFLVYGRYEYGNRGNDGLSDFKRHNGFQKYDVPRYYIPITGKGKLALRLRLHRELTSVIPHKVYHFIVTVRSKWYATLNKI